MRKTSRLLSVLLALLGVAIVGCGDDDDGGGDGYPPDNPSGIGNHCQVNTDCATGECYLGPGGGYCTTACQNEGSTSECPWDTVCKPIQGGARRCLLVCGSESACWGEAKCDVRWCPKGSSCVSVSNTDLWACEPEPV